MRKRKKGRFPKMENSRGVKVNLTGNPGRQLQKLISSAEGEKPNFSLTKILVRNIILINKGKPIKRKRKLSKTFQCKKFLEILSSSLAVIIHEIIFSENRFYAKTDND